MDNDKLINNPEHEENKEIESNENESTSCIISSNIDELDKSFEIDDAEFDSF